MKSSISTCTLAVLAGISLLSQANAQVTIDWVTVGNAGNDPQSSSNRIHDESGGDGFGAVGYVYQISKYEVTNAQYTVFLNAVDASGSNPYGIWNSQMASDEDGGISFDTNAAAGSKYTVKTDMGNKPVTFVSWLDAARFTNWLHNGQGSGSTETGAYTLNGATGVFIPANAGAKFYIPTENEWYKAAYYNGANSTYSLYPNGENTFTTDDGNYYGGSSYFPTKDVGSYSSDPSFYGTFDQGGNVWEFFQPVSDPSPGRRGGSWSSTLFNVSSAIGRTTSASTEQYDFGFRVAASSVVPEPSGLVLTMLIGAGFVCHRRRSL